MVTIFAHEQFNEAWKIYTVNFTSQGRDCDEKNYEMWQYASCENDEINFMGMKKKIERRIIKDKENTCFNGKNFERKIEESRCEQCKLKV